VLISPAAQEAVTDWLGVFLDAAELAAGQVERFAEELTELRAQWTARLSTYRARLGLRGTPRADSAVARLIEILPEAPLVTTTTVQRMLGISQPAAYKAVEELTTAGIVSRRKVNRSTVGYLAGDVFDLLTFAERRLASTRWDTRQSPPVRPAPAVPQG
jgi:hypothetical protein